MKKRDVQIGKTYTVKVSGRLSPVKIISEASYGRGWDGINLATGRTVHIKSAARLRYESTFKREK